MDLTERKKRILRAIIESYIQSAEPVGSKAIAASIDMEVSSATIRNEMADLTASFTWSLPLPMAEAM